MSNSENDANANEKQAEAERILLEFGLTAEQAAKLAQSLPTFCEQMNQVMGAPAAPAAQGTPPQQAPMMQMNSMDGLIQETINIIEDTSNNIVALSRNPNLFRALQTSVDMKLGARAPAVRTDSTGKRLFSDSVSLHMDEATIKIEDGKLTADCVATAAMVQDYSGKAVLKDPGELQKACDFARQLPITDEHPEDGMVTDQGQIKGWTTPVKYDAAKERISCSIEITDGALIKKVQDGKKDVSIGFFCDVEDKEGEFKGKKYSAIQRNIVLNHLAAGIDKGRCPAGICGIGQDEADPPATEPPAADPPATEPEDQSKAETIKLILEGEKITIEEWDKLAPEEQAALLEKYTKATEEPAEEEPMDKWKELTEEEQAKLSPEELKKYKEQEAAEKEKAKAASNGEPCDCGVCPTHKKDNCANPKKDEKAKYDEETLALVDSIMDYSPPKDRAHYLSKPKADLKDTLTLLRTKAASGGIIKASDSKPATKDEAYSRLADQWRQKR